MSLSNDKRQKTGETDSWTGRSGEAEKGRARETESLLAAREHESLANTERMMEEICEWDNLKQAILHYYGVYELDPANFLWQGINTVACLARAERDKVAAPADVPPMLTIAKEIEAAIDGIAAIVAERGLLGHRFGRRRCRGLHHHHARAAIVLGKIR